MSNKLTQGLLYSVIFVLFLGLSSCSKDDEDKTVADPTSVLTSKTWVVNDNGINISGGDMASQFAITIMAALEPSKYLFKANGDLEYTQILEATGKWALASDNKTLTIKNSAGEVVSVFEITEAKSTSVKLKKVYKKSEELEISGDVTVIFTLSPE